MNDSWFAEYMFEIAAPKSYLPADLQQALDLEPVVLPPWDPMGSLAEATLIVSSPPIGWFHLLHK